MNILPKRAAALARKEIFTYLNSPAFYGVAVFFLLFCSIWLFNMNNFFVMNVATLRPYFATFPLVFVIIIPALTMKSWAEERKTGSIELLLTMPLSEWDLVLGKFFACASLLAVMLALTIPLPLSLIPLGSFDFGVIVCEYIGALLLGSTAIALGLLMSSLSKNQAGSFLACAALLLVFMLIQQFTLSFDLPSWLGGFINFISMTFHYESFARGLIDSRDLFFYLLSTGLFLFLNTQVLLYRKWS